MASGTILVVEDHPLNRELVVDILEAAGYTMLQAEDGIGLLEVVKAERPDLIILDLQLPAVDGLSLARQLKADPATQSIPVLAMSTYAPSRRCRRKRKPQAAQASLPSPLTRKSSSSPSRAPLGSRDVSTGSRCLNEGQKGGRTI